MSESGHVGKVKSVPSSNVTEAPNVVPFLLTSKVRLASAVQLSELPLFKSTALIVTEHISPTLKDKPVAQSAVGGVVSIMVMV